WTCTPRWRRWPDERGATDRPGRRGAAGEAAGDGPVCPAGAAVAAGPGLRRRGAAGAVDPCGEGRPRAAGLARPAADRRAGAARGAAGADVAEALRAARRADAGELRLRAPAGGRAVQARGAGDLRLAAGAAGAVDPRPSRCRENTFSSVVRCQ